MGFRSLATEREVVKVRGLVATAQRFARGVHAVFLGHIKGERGM